jgi:hypothetical protein
MLGSVEGLSSSSCMRLRLFSVLIAVLQRHLRWERSQTTQSQQVIGSAHEVGMSCTRAMPRKRVRRSPPQLFIQPKISSTPWRFLWLTQ